MTAMIWTLAAIATLILTLYVQGRRGTRRMNESGQRLVKSTFGGGPDVPGLEIRWAYSYPQFTLQFPSINARLEAESNGTLQTFSDRLQELCGHIGPKSAPFDVTKALQVTPELPQKH